VQDLVAFAARPIPLAALLDGIPARLARIFGAPVVSLYLAEDHGKTLVMRGNVGFSASALGRVRLRMGEGLAGAAARSGELLVCDDACGDERSRRFPDLDEEQVPVLGAAPLVGDGPPLGVLVVRRQRPPLDASESALLAARSGVVAAAVRGADLSDHLERRARSQRRAGGGTRRLVLRGRPAVPGRALGPLAAVRRPPRLAALRPDGDAVQRLTDAFATASRVLRGLVERSEQRGASPEDAGFLHTYLEILQDARFKERSLELVAAGQASAAALGQVAREAVRAATRLSRDRYLQQRARDMEDLCDALAMLAASDPRAAVPVKTVLIADALSVYDLLVTARSRPVGVALTERAGGPRTRVLLELLGLPAILDLTGLFRWASDGDIALLDATHGLLLINPSRAEVGEARHALAS
jgi:phosphotransferase system enzyme I (PtsP)